MSLHHSGEPCTHIFWRKYKNVPFRSNLSSKSFMTSNVFCSSFECVGVRECQGRRASGGNSSILALLFKTNANQSALSTCDSLALSLPVLKETVTLISCSSSLFLCPPLTAASRTIPTTPLKSHCLPNNYHICFVLGKGRQSVRCRITCIRLTPFNYFLILFAFSFISDTNHFVFVIYVLY